MSIVNILSYNNKRFKDFRDLLVESFPPPRVSFNETIKAPPEPANYMLIGKAFFFSKLKRNK